MAGPVFSLLDMKGFRASPCSVALPCTTQPYSQLVYVCSLIEALLL